MRHHLVAVVSISLAGIVAHSPQASALECTITVAESNIEVHGTDGSDVICVVGDNNTIYAGGGDDVVTDEGTGNRIFLQDGADIYNGTSGDSSFVDGGSGNDQITGTPGEDDLNGGIGDDDLIGGEGIDSLNGGDGADVLEGGPGNDSLTGEVGDDTLDGGDDNDTLTGGDGNDSLVGGSGGDTITGGTGADTLVGNAGNDSLMGEVGDDSLDGGDDNDTLTGGDGNDSLVGGSGGDTITGGNGADTLVGNAGNDSLMGEVGSDSLDGGDGDDVLVGGENLDILDGGIGLNKCDYTDNEVKVSSCLYDDSPPRIESLTFTAPSWDSTNAQVDISVNLRITDEVGLRSGRILCLKPATSTTIEHAAMDLRFEGKQISNVGITATLISSTFNGTLSDASINVIVRLNKGTPPGQYNCHVNFGDSSFNGVSSVTSGAFQIVRQSGEFDDEAPVLVLDSFSPQPVNSAETSTSVVVKFHAEDPSGPLQGQFQCSMNKNGNWYEAMNLAWWDPARIYNYADGKWTPSISKSETRVDFEVRITIPQGTMPGTYSCGGHQSDSLGNHAIRGGTGTFVVVNESLDRDDQPPLIVDGRSAPSTVDVGSQGQEIQLSWRITDSTGFSWGYVACRSGSHQILDAVFNSGSIHDYSGRALTPTITGTAQDRSFSLPLKIPFGTQPGKYLCGVSASDSLQHWSSAVFAEVIVDRTPPGMPTAPSSLAFEPNPARPSEGTLSWTPPANLGIPALFDYEVEVSRNGTSWTPLTDPVSSTAIRSLSNLATAANYWFRVRGDNGGNAVTGSPGATWSQPLKVTTPNPLVPSAPTDIVLSNLTSTSVSMSWSASNYDGGSAVTNFTIHLSRDGGETWNLVPRVTSTSRTTLVTGLTPATEYRVRVSAINLVGTSEPATSSFITPTSLSTSPTGLQAKEVASTTLKLAWGLPTSNGGLPITDYQVEYSSNGGATWNAIAREPSPSLTFTVTGLSKGTAYRFRVAAINANGTGAWSPVASATTLAEVPSSPVAFSASSISTVSTKVEWSAPTSTGGSPIIGYAISASRDSGNTWSDFPQTVTSARSLLISGMAPGTLYLLRVQAINIVGRSEPALIEVTTLTSTPLAPSAVTAHDVTTTSLRLEWGLPTSNGGLPITDYQVEYSSNGGTTWNAIAHEPSQSLIFNVTGLSKGTAYRFRVAAINANGTGAWSLHVDTTTLAEAPAAPRSVAASSVTSNSGQINWTPPLSNGGATISGYVVATSRDSGESWSELSIVGSNARSLKVSGMAPGTAYLIRVQAINIAGRSEPATTQITTSPGVAPPPGNLTASDIATTSLNLSWSLPASNGGRPIVDYKIEVSTNGTQFRSVFHSASNSLGMRITNLRPGTAYWFRVSTVTSFGTGLPSNALRIVTVGTPPSAPASISLSARRGVYTLSWGAPTTTGSSSVRNYVVELSMDGGVTWTAVTKPASTSRSLRLNGLLRQVTYNVRVFAVNDVGSSVASRVITFTSG